MLSKMDLTGQMDAKSGQLKNESKSEMFSAPGDAQESAYEITINVFDVCLMIQFRVHLITHLELHLNVQFQDLYKGTQKDPPEITLKGALQVALELPLYCTCWCTN